MPFQHPGTEGARGVSKFQKEMPFVKSSKNSAQEIETQRTFGAHRGATAIGS